MLLAYERGECDYYESYDYVRERMADQAGLLRKQWREDRTGTPAPEMATGHSAGTTGGKAAMGDKGRPIVSKETS